MIKLNWEKVRVGQKVIVPESMFYGTPEFAGEYIVSEIGIDHGPFLTDVYITSVKWRHVQECDCENLPITRGSKGDVIMRTRKGVIAYLLGRKVKSSKNWVSIDPYKYQPEIGECLHSDYFTEDGEYRDYNEVFGYWDNYNLSMHRVNGNIIQCAWCYGKLPWEVKR